MKLQQVVGRSTISQIIRHRLEREHFHNPASAQRLIQRAFPNHVVMEKGDELSVMVRDKSFVVAVFKQVA